LGDLDAWHLPGGLYLQSAGPCGVLQIFKQRSNGSITLVMVPNTIRRSLAWPEFAADGSLTPHTRISNIVRQLYV